MTRGSVMEYREAIRQRYIGARKKEKARILEEFTNATGYHRKAAIRTLYQRLLECGALTQDQEAKLEAYYRRLNPVQLLNYTNVHLEKLWKLADRPIPQPITHLKVESTRKKEAISVTRPVEATAPFGNSFS